jgi:hypothetical protein
MSRIADPANRLDIFAIRVEAARAARDAANLRRFEQGTTGVVQPETVKGRRRRAVTCCALKAWRTDTQHRSISEQSAI